jgi:hypothetical protein
MVNCFQLQTTKPNISSHWIPMTRSNPVLFFCVCGCYGLIVFLFLSVNLRQDCYNKQTLVSWVKNFI